MIQMACQRIAAESSLRLEHGALLPVQWIEPVLSVSAKMALSLRSTLD